MPASYKAKLFGVGLRRFRKAYKISGDELAKIIGTHKQTISKYETGERIPNIDFALKVASVFGTTVEEIAGFSEDCNPYGRSELFVAFDDLTEEGQAKVIEYAKDMLKLYEKKKAGK